MCCHTIDEYIYEDIEYLYYDRYLRYMDWLEKYEDKEWIMFYDMRLYYLEIVDRFFEMYDELEWYLAQHIPLNQLEKEMWNLSRILKYHLT